MDKDIELFSLLDLEKYLPKGYRLHTIFADTEGPLEIVTRFRDPTFLQYNKGKVKAKLFGFIPYCKKVWVDVGEAPPSLVGLTSVPCVVIYKRAKEHFSTIQEALKNSQFKVLQAGPNSEL